MAHKMLVESDPHETRVAVLEEDLLTEREWGFVGVSVVLLLYPAYLANVAAVALRAQDRAGILLVVGLGSTFAFHVLYNSAMVIGLVRCPSSPTAAP